MPEPLALRAQLRALAGIRRGRIDLVELEAHQVEVALPRALPVRQFGQLALGVAHGAMGGAVGLAKLQVSRPGEPVEDVQLGRAQREAAMLVLAEEREEPGAQELQVGHARGAALDVGARAPRRADPPGDDQLRRVLGKPLGQLGQLGVFPKPRRHLEDALDVRLARARPDDLGARLAAHQEIERVREHGLSRAGLARDRVQTRPQPELSALDQEEVLDSQLEQHPYTDSGRRRRIRPSALGPRLLPREPPELLADPPVEVPARQLGQASDVVAEADLDRVARLEIRDVLAVDHQIHGLATRQR